MCPGNFRVSPDPFLARPHRRRPSRTGNRSRSRRARLPGMPPFLSRLWSSRGSQELSCIASTAGRSGVQHPLSRFIPSPRGPSLTPIDVSGTQAFNTIGTVRP
jgi:hypothetical protein